MCVCDYDPPTFYHRAEPTARKRHKCSECGGVILPGETYDYFAGKWDGYFDQFKTCRRCTDIRLWVEARTECLCWSHGNMIDDCRVEVDETATPGDGLRFGFLRRLVLRDRLNRQRREAATA